VAFARIGPGEPHRRSIENLQSLGGSLISIGVQKIHRVLRPSTPEVTRQAAVIAYVDDFKLAVALAF